MSRRIETGSPTRTLAPGQAPADGYLGRLVGYIPSEIVALYLAVSGFVPEQPASTREVALWVISGICFVLTPIYFRFATLDPKKGSLKIQILLASIAFPIWVFAIGGPFVYLPWYEGSRWIASAVLAVATVLFGWIEPKPGT